MNVRAGTRKADKEASERACGRDKESFQRVAPSEE